MTSNTGDSLQLWVHQQLAKEVSFKLGILAPLVFMVVAWSLVHIKLHEVPRLFQLWAYKQVMNIVGTNLIQSWYKPHNYSTCSVGKCLLVMRF